uniref:Nuclear pore complex protein Nup85 n=1 Tax=Odontella aurita TaxID=265563 RepID=A0A7S4JXR0_9STRA|mmetsp:Transcript_56568/g.169189  ORF Transcript_56568/g.169189 Transcript_56568/m.169189 type:complete len:383 (+) Transcript_56568:10-1158(+)
MFCLLLPFGWISSLSVFLMRHTTPKAMLSALLVHLFEVTRDGNKAEQGRILPLLVSAYPDMQPWQVRKAAFMDHGNARDSTKTEERIFSDFYYSYLSYLLDPEEGNEGARRDHSLVEEWCQLSISDHQFKDTSGGTVDKLNNFHSVASKKGDDWVLYHRDLPMLMDLSMEIGDIELALDLATEIITQPPHCHNSNDLLRALLHLRFIGESTIQSSDLADRHSLQVLRRTILNFNMMATSKLESARKSISMSEELIRLLESCAKPDVLRTTEREQAFVTLVAENASPKDVITTLAKWNRSNAASVTVMPALRSSLTWGARGGVQKELSGALMRIRQARGHDRHVMMKDTHDWQHFPGHKQALSGVADGRIWQKLMSGDARIKK